MEYSYTSADYNAFLLAALGGVLLLCLTVAILAPRFAVRRGINIGYSFLLFGFFLVGFLMLGVWAVPFLEWTGCLAIPGEDGTVNAAGRIETVSTVENTPPYWIDSERCGAVFLTIGEESYYVIDRGNPEPGMHIAFTYAPEGNVIVRWKEVTEEEAARIGFTPLPMPEPEPERQVPPWLRNLSRVLCCAGFGIFGVMIIAQTFFGMKISRTILGRDARHRDGVIPGYWGLLEVLTVVLAFGLLVTSSAITSGEYHGFFVLVLGGGVMIFLTLLDSQTRLCIRGRKLVISRFSKVQTRDLGEITSVRWEKTRAVSGWMLVIRFARGGSLELKAENHLGLTELKKRLTQLLEMQENMEKA